MSDEHGVDCAIVAERQRALEKRVASLEAAVQAMTESSTALLVELKVLQTRVSLYAALMALGVSAVFKYLFGG